MDDASGQLGVRVKYYDKTQDAWLTLGGNVLPLGFTPDRHTEVALDTAPNGTPYVVYTNTLDQGFPYMMYLDPDTRQWSNPAKLADLDASGLNLKFTSDGVGYVTFTTAISCIHYVPNDKDFFNLIDTRALGSGGCGAAHCRGQSVYRRQWQRALRPW